MKLSKIILGLLIIILLSFSIFALSGAGKQDTNFDSFDIKILNNVINLYNSNRDPYDHNPQKFVNDTTISSADVSNKDENDKNKFVVIGGLSYNVRTDIYQSYIKLEEPARSIFVENLKLYEKYKEKIKEYNIKKNKRIIASENSVVEPPFDHKMCPELPITSTSKWNFCSCGDSICASYEYIGECILDCGSCPDGAIFRAGECIEFVPNICMNKICEGDEEKTCPWDCNIQVIEEAEEFPSEEIEETLPELIG